MNEHTQRPIGVFDSGIGGLAVARAISDLLPLEQIVYFGDTAHLPYGDKSRDLIRSYSLGITDYLLREYDCKCIVIACNTASAVAYEYLRDTHRGRIPIFNVIDPIVESVIADTVHRVGIIATKATIESGVYQEKLHRRRPDLAYTALATPLLAPMIEEGYYNNTISHAVISDYLSHPELAGIDALILGCTHYFIIKREIADYYHSTVKLYDATDIMAAKLKAILYKEQLLATTAVGKDIFLVSDYTESFERSAQMFYGSAIQLAWRNIWR